MFRSIRARITVPYLLITIVAMVVLAVYLSVVVREAYLGTLRSQLTQEARLIAQDLAPILSSDSRSVELGLEADRYSRVLGTRVTIIDPAGLVLADSERNPAEMDNHRLRPEVIEALSLGQGTSIRSSDTLSYDMMYVAVLARLNDNLLAVVRLARPLHAIEETIGRFRQGVLMVIGLITVVHVLTATYIARRTSGPITMLNHVVSRMAQGDLTVRLLPETGDEVGHLTRAFNEMAERLGTVIGSLSEEKGQLAAILEHMADGVVITDREGRVTLMNPAALRLLQLTEGEAIGRSLAQAVREHQIVELWTRAAGSRAEQSGLVALGRQGAYLQVVVTPLDAEAPQTAVLILQDLTALRRVEAMRRDFVGNVSHELRTPLASLKAIVEVLREGALDDPAAAVRFLDRMEGEVDSMTQMVEELLELSRIESGRVPLRLSDVRVEDLVLPVVDRLEPQADRADLEVTVDLQGREVLVRVDAERIQQVLTNLVHNALKFTPPGGRVVIGAADDPQEVVFSVRDTGIGIAREHIPRIFERFYKVEQSRSGTGTGLGLSIVRHIVLAHQGRVWVESEEGRGSTFYFSVPRAQ